MSSDMNRVRYSPSRRFGNLAEDFACMFLVKNGYSIVDRNYLKKWGELDIVAKKGATFHFIEVKSSLSRENVTHETLVSSNSIVKNIVSRIFSQNSFTKLNDFEIIISRESESGNFNPSERVGWQKQQRMMRTIETYILEREVPDDQEWQIDVMTVKIDFSHKKCIIQHIEDVIFE